MERPGWRWARRRRGIGIAGAAALMTLVGTVGAAVAPAARAATPGCGAACVDLFSSLYGSSAAPGFVLDARDQSEATGEPIVLDSASAGNQGEDFTMSEQGTVDEFFQAGLMSQGMDELYGNLLAYEIEYTPNGAPTGLCIGVASTPGDGTPVTLQPCGVSSKTVWVEDPDGGFESFISGATNSDFTHPYALTAPPPGLPLFTFASGSVDDHGFPNQLWGTDTGILSEVAGSASRFAGVTAPIAADPAPGAPAAAEAAIAPAPATAYVADLISGALTSIAIPSQSPLDLDGIAQHPDAVAITPDGTTVYVTDGIAGTVMPIDFATGTLGSPISVGGWAYAVAITPDGRSVYAAGFDSGTVTPIDVATNTAGTPIPVGGGPDAIAITPDGKTAYVASFDSGTVTPIDVATNTAGTPIPVGGGPDAIAITPDGKTAYVADSSDATVTPIDVATNTAGTPIPVGGGPDAIAITPDGKTAYVADSSDATVTPIDVASGAAGDPISVGVYPDGLAVTPDGTTVLVSNWFDGTVTPIDVATNAPQSAIAVDAGPRGVAVAGALQIGNDPALPSATAGTPYSQPLWSVAGTAPFSYSVTSGSLPSGLSLSSSGVISGTPTEGQDASFAVTVTDSSTDQQLAVKTFTLTVEAAPTVVTQPSDQTVDPGAGASFTVAFSGNPAATIQWQVSTDGGTTFADIAGATSTTLTLSAVTAAQSGDRYRAVGSNPVSSDVASNAAVLSVNPPAPSPPVGTPPPPSGSPPAVSGPPPVPAVAGCPAASGRLAGTRLGRARLGETQAQAEHAYPQSSARGHRYEEFFCLTPNGIRVGYASPQLLLTLGRAQRRRYEDRVIWISTANPFYAVDGVRPGSTVSAARKRLRLGRVFVVGANDWYLGPAGSATAILKVRRGVVQEIGIAGRKLTRTRAAQRIFLHSFG